MESGLLPGTDPEKSAPILSLCIPVVWLTQNPGAPNWMLRLHKDAVRLEVDVKKKRAVHWLTWMQESEVRVDGECEIPPWRGVDVLDVIRSSEHYNHFAPAMPDFYIHFGPIPVRRIKSIDQIRWQCPDNPAALEEHQARLDEAAA